MRFKDYIETTIQKRIWDRKYRKRTSRVYKLDKNDSQKHKLVLMDFKKGILRIWILIFPCTLVDQYRTLASTAKLSP